MVGVVPAKLLRRMKVKLIDAADNTLGAVRVGEGKTNKRLKGSPWRSAGGTRTNEGKCSFRQMLRR